MTDTHHAAQAEPVRAGAYGPVQDSMRRATYASVGVALVLVATKFVAWLLTGSVALLSSLVDSAMDVVASALNLLAVRHAIAPADREHRFGHGKAEALAGLAQAIFIAGSALFVLIEAANRLRHPEPIVNGVIGLAVMVLSIVLTLGLVVYQRHVVRTTGSLAVGADSVHYETDLVTNLAVIAGVALASWFRLPLADPVIAVGISAYIAYSAWRILRNSYDQLMDRELPDAERKQIRQLALSHPEIHDVHELRTRMSGAQIFIQLHVEMNPQLPLERAHAIADEVELQLKQAFPGAEIFIHQDPVGELRPAAAR